MINKVIIREKVLVYFWNFEIYDFWSIKIVCIIVNNI